MAGKIQGCFSEFQALLEVSCVCTRVCCVCACVHVIHVCHIMLEYVAGRMVPCPMMCSQAVLQVEALCVGTCYHACVYVCVRLMVRS